MEILRAEEYIHKNSWEKYKNIKDKKIQNKSDKARIIIQNKLYLYRQNNSEIAK